MLFIWGSLNPKVRYIQGLNEIIAPIFYLFNHERGPGKVVEAEVMFTFNVFVSNIMDILIRELDDCEEGMHGRAHKLERMLGLLAPELAARLAAINASTALYAIRWLTMLFAQDFEIFDVLSLWDALIFSGNFSDYLDYLCLAVLLARREQLLQADFGTAMELLRDVQELGVARLV